LNSAVALVLVATAVGRGRADTIESGVSATTVDTPTVMAYTTVGSTVGSGVGTDGTAQSVVSFVPVSGTALTPSNLSLGSFQAAALADGQSVTFDNTPFTIKFTATSVNGATDFQPNDTPFDIKGFLNGTLTGDNHSTVTATFGPIGSTGPQSLPLFATGLYTNLLKVPDNPLSIVPSTTNSGRTTAQAYVASSLSPNSPVPEPSTVVLFSATIAGLAFRHRIRRARAAA
jgi:hypothetical protein